MLVGLLSLSIFGLALCKPDPHSSNPSHSKFHPARSSSFQLIKLGNVNITFLDDSNLLGYDGSDFVRLGGYRVKTRFGLITDYNSAEFDDVDGILGFGWGGDFLKSAAILNTLSTSARPEWHIVQDKDYVPMPRMFAFTASDAGAELQLGGYDPASILGTMHMAPMVGVTYSVNVSSIKYNGEELLIFSKEGPVIPPNPHRTSHDPSKPYRPGPYKAYSGLFDSGTTCNLIPDSTVFGVFDESPYQRYLAAKDRARHLLPLEYTINGRTFMLPVSDFDCLESAENALILGDPWFRQFVIFHDLRHHEVTDKTINVLPSGNMIGIGIRRPGYSLTPPDSSMSLSTNGAVAFVSDPTVHKLRHVQKLSLQRIDVNVEHPRAKLIGVNKVGLKAQSMVTYNVKITVGSPEQLLTVIFDTGSFMCAVFSDVSPEGMKEIGLLSIQQYFGHSSRSAYSAMALAFACSVFVVALAVHARGKKGSRRDTRLAAVDVM